MFKKILWIGWLLTIPLFAQDRLSLESQLQQIPAVSRTVFSFCIIGDRTGAAADSWAIFDRAVAEVNELRPDFCLMVGDLIDGAQDAPTLETQWEEAAGHAAALRSPLFMCAGNHDIPGRSGYDQWTKHVGKTYYAFEAMGCRFLVLNTEEAQGTGGSGFGNAQLEFAERILTSVPKEGPLFVLMHQPAWFGSGTLKAQWNRLEPLLPRVNVTVVAGHLHALAMKKLEGRNYLIVGPTGGKLRMERNPAMGLVHHVTRVTMENGKSSMVFIEPGRIYSEQTALDAYERYMKGLLLLRGQGAY